MTIQELIKELEKLSPDMEVVVPSDIGDYRFYGAEGVNTFEVENQGK